MMPCIKSDISLLEYICVFYCDLSVELFVLGNIANYLELSEVVSVYMPVPVNFIFIGFDGKGNQGTVLTLILIGYVI